MTQYEKLVMRLREGVNGTQDLHAYDYTEGIYIFDAKTKKEYWLSEITSAVQRERERVIP